MAKATQKATVVEIRPINNKRIMIPIKGESEFVSHAWDKRSRESMLLVQQGVPKPKKKPIKDPVADYGFSMYWISKEPAKMTEAAIKKGKFGIPTIAFKCAAVDACSQIDGITKVLARSVIHINGEFVEIKGKPHMREDMVRVGMGSADIRFRAGFDPWAVDLDVTYNADVLSAEQVVNLFNLAGFGVGVGDWRPQRNGEYGRFSVKA